VQDTNTATEPGNNPTPLVGDPNDRSPATEATSDTAGSGELADLNSRRFDDLDAGDSTEDPPPPAVARPLTWQMRSELALVLSEIGFERDRQIEMYPADTDDYADRVRLGDASSDLRAPPRARC
jgi:hypothetical protein